MESIKRSIMLLRPGDGPHAHPQSRGTLKLQAVPGGIGISLTITGLPPAGYMLHLFLEDGATIFAGDVTGGGLRRTLPGIRLQSVAAAAVIHSASAAFCLKSTGIDWKDTMTRFKLLHSPRPAQPAPPPEAPPLSVAIPPARPQPEMSETMGDNIPDALSDLSASDEADEAPTKIEIKEDIPAPWTASAPYISEDCNEEPDPCSFCPHAAQQQRVNPFPLVFPQSEWTKMAYPGPTGWWHYISGCIYNGPNIVAKAVGVPGEYGMMPPVWLEGFGTYLHCDSPDAHGYWLMFQDAESGEILDMGLSPRDA